MPDEKLFFDRFCKSFRESLRSILKNEDNLTTLEDLVFNKENDFYNPSHCRRIKNRNELDKFNTSFISKNIDFIFTHSFTLDDSIFRKNTNNSKLGMIDPSLEKEVLHVRTELSHMILSHKVSIPVIKELLVFHSYGTWINIEIAV
jgi:hypothetical protein